MISVYVVQIKNLKNVVVNKMDKDELTSEVLISDLLIRLTALERILINKGLVLPEELALEANNITKTIAMSILNKSNVPNADKIIKTFTGEDND